MENSIDVILAQTSLLNQQVSSLTNILGVTTAILGVFFTISLGVIAILTWNQNKLRQKAEKEVLKITAIHKDMVDFSKTVKSWTDETMKKFESDASLILKNITERAQLAESYEKKLKSTVKDINSTAKKVATTAKKTDKSLTELTSKMEDKVEKLNESVDSLASMPSISLSPSLGVGGGGVGGGAYALDLGATTVPFNGSVLSRNGDGILSLKDS